MEIKCGDKVIYFFPEPVNSETISITGIVEYIGDYHVLLKSENDIRMKISYRNFHLIKHFEVNEV